MKVPATWDGLQACSRLKTDGIKTLATTVFTMEQAILAAEAGCISISPFAYELRAHTNPSYVKVCQLDATPVDECSYHDSEPIFDLYLEAQQYYRQHGIPTKIKSCAFMTTDEIICTAGVDAMTLPGEILEQLASMVDLQESLEARSAFINVTTKPSAPSPRLSYINDKVKYLRAYTTNGRGKAKTEDVSEISPSPPFPSILVLANLSAKSIAVFCGFQLQSEALVATAKNPDQSIIANDLPKTTAVNGSAVIEPHLAVPLTARS